MKALRNWLRRWTSASTIQKPRSRSLTLERLDQRLVPSASTISAISINEGNWTANLLYEVNSQTHQVEYFMTPSNTNYYSPGYFYHASFGGPQVKAVSATGTVAELFALGTDGRLWFHDSVWQWHSLGGSYNAISATRDGHVYALDSISNTAYLVDSSGNATYLGAPYTGYNAYEYTFRDISAGVDQFGRSVVYAAALDGHIYQGSTFGPWQIVDSSANFEAVSASQAGGVYGLDVNGHVHQDSQYAVPIYSPYTGLSIYYFWNDRDVSGGNTYQSISADRSASGAAEVYAVTSYGYDYLINSSGSAQQLGSYGITNIAGSDGGYYFTVQYGTHVQANNPAYSWAITLGTY